MPEQSLRNLPAANQSFISVELRDIQDVTEFKILTDIIIRIAVIVPQVIGRLWGCCTRAAKSENPFVGYLVQSMAPAIIRIQC